MEPCPAWPPYAWPARPCTVPPRSVQRCWPGGAVEARFGAASAGRPRGCWAVVRRRLNNGPEAGAEGTARQNLAARSRTCDPCRQVRQRDHSAKPALKVHDSTSLPLAAYDWLTRRRNSPWLGAVPGPLLSRCPTTAQQRARARGILAQGQGGVCKVSGQAMTKFLGAWIELGTLVWGQTKARGVLAWPRFAAPDSSKKLKIS